jgi:cob(I)alamin adenosyltransferase
VVDKHEILNEEYQKKKQEIDELRKKLFKAQDELSKLNRTLKEIQDHNEQMVSAIAVTRTGTLRAEENVVQLEKSKKKQDVLIDSINEEIKRK